VPVCKLDSIQCHGSKAANMQLPLANVFVVYRNSYIFMPANNSIPTASVVPSAYFSTVSRLHPPFEICIGLKHLGTAWKSEPVASERCLTRRPSE
jgi:hypothetical protein